MANFDTPYYLDNFEKQFRFSEYEDNENYFLRLVYLIRRTEYAKYATPHGTYPSLDVNITAHNGKKIFRDAYDVFDGGKSFKLLSESARDRAPNDLPGVIQVEQVYGYAPAATHIRSEEVDWQSPGIIDRSTGASFPVTTAGAAGVDYDSLAETYQVTLASTPVGLGVGDVVHIRAWVPYINSGTSWTAEGQGITDSVPVLAVVGNLVTIDATPMSWRWFAPGGLIEGTMAPSVAANFGGTNPPSSEPNFTLNKFWFWSQGWRRFGEIVHGQTGTCDLVRLYDYRSPQPMSIGAVVERRYFYASAGLPQQRQAFGVKNGSGQSVEDADIYTIPTAAEYQAMITTSYMIRPRSERIGQVMGDVWFIDTWLIAAQ